MRYEDQWNDRDDRRDRSRQDWQPQADASDKWRGREREDRDFSGHRDREREHDEHRTWAPFGETGPTRYGGGGDSARYDRGSRSGGDDYRDRSDRGFGSGRYDRDRDGRARYGGGRDSGFGETGGRHSASYDHEQYGRRDQWGSNPRSGSGNDARNWFDRASDQVQSWFGDNDAQRRREWDEVRAGQHRGRGPKGYRRSDERMRDDVSDRLSDDSWLDASDIEVRVENGEVTLTGFVSSRDDKRRAEDLAERVSGVENVQNQIRVRRDDQRSMERTSGDGAIPGAGQAGTTTGSGRA
jgi:osmotically-inducible protein OsmY